MKRIISFIKTLSLLEIILLTVIFLALGYLLRLNQEISNRYQVCGETLILEVADTPEKRAKGLSKRDYLKTGHGMLFINPTTQVMKFWMKNTKIPLDIAFFDVDGQLINYKSMKVPENPTILSIYESKAPAKYAVETNIGFFSEENSKNCYLEIK